MKNPKDIKVFGDKSYRGACLSESSEQSAFFTWLKYQYPNLAAIAIHPRNEGKRTYGQARYHKIEGMTKGASDIIIPAAVPFVCELKRKDHTKSTLSKDQLIYLENAQKLGAFACVALGFKGAKLALAEWGIFNKN